MEVLPVNRLCKINSSLLPRELACRKDVCSRAFQTVSHPAKACSFRQQRQASHLVLRAQAAAAPVAFQSVDESVYDETCSDKYPPLQYGLATLQGPRDDMEDYASIVARGKCGFLYAGVWSQVVVHCSC